MHRLYRRVGADTVHLALMLALTFSTGVIDAAGFLGLDRVFTGNMTGNVAILGMAVAGADDLPIVGPIVALIAFVLGAALAGRLARHGQAGWSSTTSVLLAFVALLLLIAAGLSLLSLEDKTPIAQVLTALLGLAMGAQAGAARAVATKDVTTVVVTSTLVGLAYDSRLAASNTHPWMRRLLAVLLLGLGALSGALLLSVDFAWSVGMAAVVTACVALAGEHHRRAAIEEEPG